MFRETLLIIPRISSGDVARMEQSLGTRFRQIARGFKTALNFAIKGSVIGISLGLLTRLLNPLEKIIDRTEKLLGQSTDLSQLADKLGTTPEQVLIAQTAAQNLGIKPEDFKKLLESFSDAVEKARDELKNPFAPRTETTTAIKNFLSENSLQGFSDFLASLNIRGAQNTTTPQFLSKRAQEDALTMTPAERKRLVASGEIRLLTGAEVREQLSKLVLGEKLSGTVSGEKFLGNFNAEVERVKAKGPGIHALSIAAQKLEAAQEAQNRAQAKNELQNFVRGGELVTPSLVKGLEAAKQRDINQTFSEMEPNNINRLFALKEGLDAIEGALLKVQDLLSTIINLILTGLKLDPVIASALRKLSGGGK